MGFTGRGAPVLRMTIPFGVLSPAPREGAVIFPIFPLPIVALAVAVDAAHEDSGDTTNYSIQEIQVEKFEDIRYAERIGKYGKTLGLSMPGGFWVFKETMITAWISVHENWTNINWTNKQTAATLIGSGVWHVQVAGAKKALGRCIRFFVKHDMLPLRLVLAKTRKGKSYKGGKRFYVLAHTSNVDVVPVMEIPAIRAARNREFLAHADWAALQQATPTVSKGEPS